MAREASLHPISEKYMWNDCGLYPASMNLECVSILLSSIWDSDFHGFGNLGLKRGRDFRGGDPMAVQEALAMERSLIGGWQ
ncbi:hypothetical protein TNCV_4594951 [Trichonephila clavipes]|uniref:Uncharacterized protein n=1 Tax=Trichonephila clavipes TaxID=2585209 RepID=A0A8X7BJT3_TRICX|nr:hypothetical protein TNCV_4594951 [Trichonephila clavipes]